MNKYRYICIEIKYQLIAPGSFPAVARLCPTGLPGRVLPGAGLPRLPLLLSASSLCPVCRSTFFPPWTLPATETILSPEALLSAPGLPTPWPGATWSPASSWTLAFSTRSACAGPACLFGPTSPTVPALVQSGWRHRLTFGILWTGIGVQSLSRWRNPKGVMRERSASMFSARTSGLKLISNQTRLFD